MIYGAMLQYFPELMRRYSCFSMEPKSKASYEERKNIRDIMGICQDLSKGKLDIESESISDVMVPTLWTSDPVKIGEFIDRDGIIYRIVKEINWIREGGFSCFEMSTVTGNTGEQEEFPPEEVSLGQNHYD